MENNSPIDSAIYAVHEEISELATNYRNAIVGINNACSKLNEEMGPPMIQRSSSATLLGKEAAPLLGSLKTLGENIFKANVSNENIEENLEKASIDMKKSSQQLESFAANLNHNMETLQSIMDYTICSIGRTSTPRENWSDTDSDTSFESTDIVTSSPFTSSDRMTEMLKKKIILSDNMI
ncbi:unnamed protein product [Ceutorhynchus assimilis]|uniref:Uncharacterized protein n=1 Tax=Ceutorhynchus assimilis TaxID=467358 RepID=A0A9N9MZJ4_9CUCU|nr:unnamed protein product [Ceutorhynchus assimilis]